MPSITPFTSSGFSAAILAITLPRSPPGAPSSGGISPPVNLSISSSNWSPSKFFKSGAKLPRAPSKLGCSCVGISFFVFVRPYCFLSCAISKLFFAFMLAISSLNCSFLNQFLLRINRPNIPNKLVIIAT